MVKKIMIKYNLDTNPKFTIISYPELDRDYVEFFKEFEMQPLPEDLDTTLRGGITRELQGYCTELVQSRIFELIPLTETGSRLRRIRSSRSPPGIQNTRFLAHRVKIGSFVQHVPMFPCFMSPTNSDHFYIAYGFNQGYMFIFKHLDQESGLKLFGLVEPTPFIDKSFWDMRHLEKFFIQNYGKRQPKPRNLDPICSLTGYQQFRLCSILENVRRYDKTGKSVAEDEMINTERKHQTRCEENMTVSFEKLERNNPAYASLRIKITALPCHTNKNQLTFLVSQDPTDEYSVFILERCPDPDTGVRKTKVVQHVRDIALLRYANNFY